MSFTGKRKRPLSKVSYASLVKRGAYRSFGHSNPALEALTDTIIEQSAKHRGDPEDQMKTIGDLLGMFVDGRLDVFPEYQRGAVLDMDWARDIVRLLLFTSAPIAPLMLRECVDPDGTKRYEVVDGAQRMTAILLFAMGALTVRVKAHAKEDETELFGWPSDVGPVGYEYLFGGVEDLRCADFMDDGTKVYDTMFRFAARAEGLVTPQTQDANVMDPADAGRFLNKTIRMIVFPTSWPDKLCILYAMYTELKHLRQTKDECLLHLHDRASQALKPLASVADAAASNMGIDASSKKPYGWVFKVHAMLNGEPVPTDANEREYMGMMCRAVEKYMDAAPCPSRVSRIKTAAERLRALSGSVKTRLGRTSVSPDLACMMLWKLVEDPSCEAENLAHVAYFATRRTAKDRLKVAAIKLGDEGEAVRICEEYRTAGLRGDLRTMAEIAVKMA
nr:DUF262 domain-containing protein [Oceanusvirus sp.]